MQLKVMVTPENLHHLVKALCNSQIERRKSEVCTYTRNTVAKMNLILGQRRQSEETTAEVIYEN